MVVDKSYIYNRVYHDVGVKGGHPKKYEQINRNRLKHVFPAPLQNGYLRCYVRQGRKQHGRGGYGFSGVMKNDCLFFGLDLLDEQQKELDSIITIGNNWPTTREQLVNETGRQWDVSLGLWKSRGNTVSIAVDDWYADGFAGAWPEDKTWHEIKVVARPGERLEALVDGRSIGRIDAESLAGIRIYSHSGDSMVMDDVELFYAGDAGEILAAHRAKAE
jgi:hypothetical protein